MSTSPTSTPPLQDLHDRYVAAINLAVADGLDDRVAELSASYEDEALALIGSAA